LVIRKSYRFFGPIRYGLREMLYISSTFAPLKDRNKTKGIALKSGIRLWKNGEGALRQDGLSFPFALSRMGIYDAVDPLS
jgi:hypothetical protein